MTDDPRAELAAALHRCVYREAAAPALCGQPAITHYLVGTDPGTVTMVCADHVLRWNAGEIFDEHPVAAVCGMPGAWWLGSGLDPAGVGYCYVPGIEAAADLAVAAVTA